jgi:hypothetical protein
MKLRRPQDQGIAVILDEIEPFFLELLKRIPAAADPGANEEALARLFSPATAEPDAEFNQDWQDYVEPELRELFRSAQEIVAGDLGALPAPGSAPLDADPAAFEPTTHTLEIPRPHIEAWLGVLNQARLVIAAKRNFGEREMDEELVFPPASERDLDLFRIHFYDFIQQILLRELGYE